MFEIAIVMLVWILGFDRSPVFSSVAAVIMIPLIFPGMYATLTGAPFVPSGKKIMKKMMELAEIQSGNEVYDLGCGDGRLVIAAALKGAKATGYELSIPTYLLAKIRCAFVKNTKVRYADFWRQNYREADVVFCYLLTGTMQEFKRVVWPQLKPGCRVVSNAFRMEGVEPALREEGVVLYVKA